MNNQFDYSLFQFLIEDLHIVRNIVPGFIIGTKSLSKETKEVVDAERDPRYPCLDVS